MASQRHILADRKDLHDGRSLWADSPRSSIRTTALHHDQTCEIAIVSGGISDAFSALMLAEYGHHVIVLDRRPPGSGSTAKRCSLPATRWAAAASKPKPPPAKPSASRPTT